MWYGMGYMHVCVHDYACGIYTGCVILCRGKSVMHVGIGSESLFEAHWNRMEQAYFESLTVYLLYYVVLEPFWIDFGQMHKHE